jgi:hypothetical protein
VGPHEVILWDLATGNELMRTGVGSPGTALLSFSADGHRLAIGGDFEDPRAPPEILDATPRDVSTGQTRAIPKK